MIARVYSATVIGFLGERIEVECDTSHGLPGIVIVGLGNKSIDEARERVRSSIKNSRLDFPRKRVTINLAPANLPKDGAHFDLSIAIALLTVSGQLKQSEVQDTLLVGELALDGALRPVRGIINCAETAKNFGMKAIIVPSANVKQALLVEGITILPADSLRDVYLHFKGDAPITPATPTVEITENKIKYSINLNDVKGQEQAKRALVIAAAGNHNILLSGPPGAGKTMLAKALVSILPPLSLPEIINTTKLHSIAGESWQEVVTTRPFRSPHHSTSHIALVGGGQNPRPGEISLAHHGVLFLDELPEYSRQALESLRQPLEDRIIHIARAKDHVSYPADFMLVATQNPCPCGYFGDQYKICECSSVQILNYRRRVSGPLLDRIDMILEVSRVDTNKLLDQSESNTANLARQAVIAARNKQYKRFKSTNTHLSPKQIVKLAKLDKSAQQLVDKASQAMNLSARSYFKVIKVARTIADLENSEGILPNHIAEALQYRLRTENTLSS